MNESNLRTHEADTPRISILIPTLDGYRNGCVPRLLESIHQQTVSSFEICLVKGVSPQGKAINQGAEQARGEILVILDDDSLLADETVLERLLKIIDTTPDIGMVGASIVLSDTASPFQRRAAHQFPRFHTPVVDTVTDSDLACHGCCAIPKVVFDEIGGEREDILRGLDPDLRVRLRAAGYRVVLAPHARIYHPMPENLSRLLRIFFRNGYGSAYAQKYQPDTVYETHEKLHDQNFQPKTRLAYRVLRFPLRLIKALLQGKSLRFIAYTAYAFGYLWGFLTAKKIGH